MYKIEIRLFFNDKDSEEEILLSQSYQTFKKDLIVTKESLKLYISEDKRDFLEQQLNQYQ